MKKQFAKIDKKIKGAKEKKEIKEKFKYKITLSVGDKVIYEAQTNDLVKTLLNTGIDQTIIDYWMAVKVKGGDKEFTVTLNVPKARNLLASQGFCEMIVDNILYNLK